MSEFDKGQHVYTRQGQKVEVERQWEDTVYVRPMLQVIYDDGGGQDECEEPADAIISVLAKDLFARPPVAVNAEEVRAIRSEIAEAKREAAQVQKEVAAEKARLERELQSAKDELERWNKEHAVFVQAGRLLDGKPMFPLHAPASPYHKGPEIPSVPKMSDVKYIALTPGGRAEEPWKIKKWRDYGSGWTIRFFESEAERDDFIKKQFDVVCDAWRSNPNFSLNGQTYSTRLDYGRLVAWCERYDFLSLPEDIASAKVSDETAQSEAKKRKLRAELEALEADQ